MTTENYFKEDKAGNKLLIRLQREGNIDIIATLKLRLKGETRERAVGDVYFSKNTLYVKRSSAKHLMIKNNSYGINYDILNDSRFSIKWVAMNIDGEKFKVPKSEFDERGTYLNFKQQGFELQKFLSVDIIKTYKI